MRQVLEDLKVLEDDWVNCTKCVIGKYTQNHVMHEFNTLIKGKMLLYKEIRPEATDCDLMILGVAPTLSESVINRPFYSRDSRRVREFLIEYMPEDHSLEVCLSNMILCRAHRKRVQDVENREPFPYEIEMCQPRLTKLIDLIKPKIILTIGEATEMYVGDLLEEIKYKCHMASLPSPICMSLYHSKGINEEIYRAHVKKIVELAVRIKHGEI